MNVDQLKHVLVLAKTLHFTKAAEEINLVQPALSRQIKQLEEEIGADLFKRNKRNVALTDAGSYFVSEIEKILNELERVSKRAAQICKGEAGELRIGFTHSVMQSILPNILKEIPIRMPGMKTILKEMNNRDQYLHLQNNELELGFATNPLVPANLKSKVMHVENFVVLLPQNHPVNQENYEDFSVFREEEFIFPSMEDGPQYVRTIESICLDAGFSAKVIHETDSASTSFRLVEAGMGISIEPAASLSGQSLSIKSIALRDISQRANLTMMWRPEFEGEYPELFEMLTGSVREN